MGKANLSLAEFQIDNFKGIKQARVTKLPAGAPWVFLTGENGYGKTVVLQALALLLNRKYGALGTNTPEPPSLLLDMVEKGIVPPQVQVHAKLHTQDPPEFYTDLIMAISQRKNENDEYKKAEAKRSTGLTAFNVHSITVGYGLSRLAKETINEENLRSNSIESLLEKPAVFFDIEAELFKWWSLQDQQPFYKPLVTLGRQLLSQIIPGVKAVHFKTLPPAIEYEVLLEDGESTETLTSSKLSAGYRALITMAGNIYLRLAGYNPTSKRAQAYQSPAQLKGFVLIDELELHLHPKWQKQLPGLLSQLFPNVQFIASTHSPIPLLGAPKGAVFLKVDKTKEGGITIKRLEKLENEIHDLLPNAVLTSPIFDFLDLTANGHKPDRLIRTEDQYNDVKFYDELRTRLAEGLSPEQQERFKKHFNSGSA